MTKTFPDALNSHLKKLSTSAPFASLLLTSFTTRDAEAEAEAEAEAQFWNQVEAEAEAKTFFDA